jgi:LPS export ABC transporter protein LptC
MINHIIHNKFLTAAIITGCFFMCACENDVNEVRELGRKKTMVEEGKQIEFYYSMSGKMRAKLIAPLLLRSSGDSGRKAEFPNSLHVDFYNDSMKVESQLNALYGRYMENENKVFLKDKVVAFNIKGDTIFCKEMYWDQNLQQFYTDKEVTISQRSPQKRFTGIGMKCNQDLTNLTLYKIQPGSFAVIADSLAPGSNK